ncbi:MAG: hypothetical protein HUU10_04275 [Bacteroidetes bacterium]|nr:hypothetical protein [Bacteroidota bacterium]
MKFEIVSKKEFDRLPPHRGYMYHELRRFVFETTDGCVQVDCKTSGRIRSAILSARKAAKEVGKQIEVKRVGPNSALIRVTSIIIAGENKP